MNYSFQADIEELMSLIINSFYSSRDIFLRELLSNSADAIERQKMKDLQNGECSKEYFIKIEYSKENNTLTILDNGEGMTKNELVENLSKIASSGTREFIKKHKEKKDLQIGQFGVGFFSSYLVATNVILWTKRKESETWFEWESDSKNGFTIKESENLKIKDDFSDHGTILKLYIKDDAKEYLEENKIEEIVTRYSGYINYPIYLGEELKRINEKEALWYKDSKELQFYDYNKLYKEMEGEYLDCLFYRHFKVEGNLEIKGILYIPVSNSNNILGSGEENRKGLRLYVKKVLVLDNIERTMLPEWMNFVSGVIDCPDLPMNVSREILQQSSVINLLKNQIRKQILKMLQDLAEDHVKYELFYKNFQKNIKLAIHGGNDKMEDLLKLLRFEIYGEEMSCYTLENYIDMMKEGQNKIYYICGNEIPILYMYKEKGYKVIYFKDCIDEFMMQRVLNYKNNEFINIGKEHEYPWEENDEKKESDLELYIKDVLSKVCIERVELYESKNVEDIGYIVSSKFGMTGNMRNILKSQPLGEQTSWSEGSQIFRLNKNHTIMEKIDSSYHKKENKDEKDHEMKDLIMNIYECCLLNSGYNIENPNEFSRRYIKLITKVL